MPLFCYISVFIYLYLYGAQYFIFLLCIIKVKDNFKCMVNHYWSILKKDVVGVLNLLISKFFVSNLAAPRPTLGHYRGDISQ